MISNKKVIQTRFEACGNDDAPDYLHSSCVIVITNARFFFLEFVVYFKFSMHL